MGSRKVLVIGLDGATWDLILRYVDNGKLPTFARLMKEGIWGKLRSTIPANTPPAWTTMLTGVNPGKHNIFGFTSYENPKRVGFPDRRSIKAKTIWDYLGNNGLKVGMINIPMTYPPSKVNGFMIAGLGAPGAKSVFTYPTDLGNKLTAKGYIIDLLGDAGERLLVSLDRFTGMVLETLERRVETILDLMKTTRWDFLMAVFTETDRVQHFFWHCIGHPEKDIVFTTYQRIDVAISEFMQNIDDQTNVFIVSDHGFCPLRKRVYINNFFRELEVIQEHQSPFTETMRELGLTKEHVLALLTKLGKIVDVSKILERIPNRLKDILPSDGFDTKDFNMAKTKIYYLAAFDGFRVNLKGRESKGTVARGEDYETLLNTIIQKLIELKDPDTGQRIVRGVYRREEIFKGPYVEHAPDLIADLEDDYLLSRSGAPFIAPVTIKPGFWSGKHSPNGIFLAWGPDIKKGKGIDGANIIDFTPTVLHLMNQPIPTNMDGHVLEDIFEIESEPAKREVEYRPEGEKERVKEKIKRLRDLGKI